MTKKIKNIIVSSTAEKIELEWSDLLSKRNKLLQTSDWTQLDDVKLEADERIKWVEWRSKVRKIKRKNNFTLEQAKNILEMLEKSKPKALVDFNNVEIDNLLETIPVESDETQPVFIKSVQQSDLKIEPLAREKVYIEKLPVIIREEINSEKLEQQFYQTFSKDHTVLHSYLKDVINKVPNIYIKDNDSIEVVKDKLLQYLILQQKYLFELKKQGLPSFDLINEKCEQALEFLTLETTLLDEYPLIELHVQLTNKTPHDIAMSFLAEKKIMNRVLIDSEKFFMYNKLRIELCDNIDCLKELTKDIKNGY